MSFHAPKGTRGGRQPKANVVFGWLNGKAVGRARRSGGRFMGMNVLVLNTVGKKTGAARETPLAWFPGDDGSWLIVGAAAGAADNPAWYYNIAADPDQVSIDIGGTRVDVTPEQLHGAARDRAWSAITTAVPRFKQYESKTDRLIPVIRLRRK